MRTVVEEEGDKKMNPIVIFLIVVGVIVVIAAVAYALYRFFQPNTLEDLDDFDEFEDDFFIDDEIILDDSEDQLFVE